MAGKHVYAKSSTGISDFVYVDLLPEVKRARQFNVNVIIALLLAVVLSFAFIYTPFRQATEDFEQLNSLNNDLYHELALTNEEFDGYEINVDTIAFDEDITSLISNKVDFNNLLDDIELLVDLHGGEITYVVYSAELSTIHLTISITSFWAYNELNNEILKLSWVESSGYSNPTNSGDPVLYSSTFTLGVVRDDE